MMFRLWKSIKERTQVYNSVLTPHYLRGSMFLQGDMCLYLHLSRGMTKPTKSAERPANTQISQGICLFWSVFAVRIKKPWELSFPLRAQRRLWSDLGDAQADQSLRWVHMPFCLFWHAAAHLYYCLIFDCIKKNKTTKMILSCRTNLQKSLLNQIRMFLLFENSVEDPDHWSGSKLFAYRNFYWNIRNE